MKRRIVWVLSVLFLVVACENISAPPDIPNVPDVPAPENPNPDNPLPENPMGPDGLMPTLLAKYHTMRDLKDSGSVPSHRATTYKPRQSDYVSYEGWDVLDLPFKSQFSGKDWLYLTLNRDAQVVVIWEGNAAWLKDWEKTTIEVNRKMLNAYTKDVSKGELVLGNPGKDKQAYDVLLAEKGGKPSAEPKLPEGITEQPVANELCPAWVHDRHITEGPDGRMYRTWHPPIDPSYWCYFGHEHGSNPELVNYKAYYDYVAYHNDKQDERHEGFKGFSIRDEQSGIGWYINVHATTGLISRACIRFHTVVIAATDLKTGELLAELAYKGDFGTVKVTNKVAGVDEPVLFAPVDCPDQQAIDEETMAEKRLRIANEPGFPNEMGYEVWLGGLQEELIGLSREKAVGLELDIINPITSCETLKCTSGVVGADFNKGDRRRIQLEGFMITYDESRDPNGDGYFYTDQYGKNPQEFDKHPDGNFIRQYIKPGLDIAAPNELEDPKLTRFFVSYDPWQGLYGVSREGEVNGIPFGLFTTQDVN